VSDQRNAACVCGSRERDGPKREGWVGGLSVPKPFRVSGPRHAIRPARTAHELAHALAPAAREPASGLPAGREFPAVANYSVLRTDTAQLGHALEHVGNPLEKVDRRGRFSCTANGISTTFFFSRWARMTNSLAKTSRSRNAPLRGLQQDLALECLEAHAYRCRRSRKSVRSRPFVGQENNRDAVSPAPACLARAPSRFVSSHSRFDRTKPPWPWPTPSRVSVSFQQANGARVELGIGRENMEEG